jgi:exodeoxyribonuclease VII large subunit
MPRRYKSQLDFGELLATEQAESRKIFTVGEITEQIRKRLEKDWPDTWVSGEITNLRAQTSGHIYFTLKDAEAQLGCVLFRGEAQPDRSLLADGRKVVLRGALTVYKPRGQYQLRVVHLEPQGVGKLQAAFEELKRKLASEGLFAPERKRTLPRFIDRVGLVTSISGAALRDVLHVVRRRNPGLELVLVSCRVQGQGAAPEIAAAIRLLNNYHVQETAAGRPGLQVLLATRGGGSLEDLWAFNEEAVARAIFHSAIPVVSAVGHEIDFTISDFVADLRAATPSAAAEILTEGVFSSCRFLQQIERRIATLARQRLQEKVVSVHYTFQRLTRLHPRRRLESLQQQLDDLELSLFRCARVALRNCRVRADNLTFRLSRLRPSQVLRQRQVQVEQTTRRLHVLARRQFETARGRLATIEARLKLLGPEQVLARGYSITIDAATGKVLRDPAGLRTDQELHTCLQHGSVRSRVESVAQRSRIGPKPESPDL